jgi:hypothetical protein
VCSRRPQSSGSSFDGIQDAKCSCLHVVYAGNSSRTFPQHGKVSFPKIISGRSGGAARSSLSVASYRSVADTHGPHPGPEDSSVAPVIVSHHPNECKSKDFGRPSSPALRNPTLGWPPVHYSRAQAIGSDNKHSRNQFGALNFLRLSSISRSRVRSPPTSR